MQERAGTKQNKRGIKMIIGITGGSGCGKSSVVSRLKADGFYAIDADVVARECVKQGKPSYNEIKAYFGDDVFLENGELDRKKLGSIVFSDENELKALNSITHKYIKMEIENEIAANKDKDIIIDAAVLNQGGLAEICDIIILVTAKKDVRIKRIIKRDNLSYENAKNRIESQPGDEEYKKYCDFTVDNSGQDSLEDIKNKVVDFINSKK